MPPTIASNAAHDTASRDALCVQAAIVLRVTAQQWGMCSQSPAPTASSANTTVARPRERVSYCAPLVRAWNMAA